MTHGSPPAARTAVVAVPAAAGVLVAVALGVYGRVHEPALVSVNVAGFSSPGAVKSWLATAAFALALVQLGSALLTTEAQRSRSTPSEGCAGGGRRAR